MSECHIICLKQEIPLLIGKDNKINPRIQQANCTANRNKFF